MRRIQTCIAWERSVERSGRTLPHVQSRGGDQNSPSYAETAEWALADLRASGVLFVNESDQQSSMLIGSDVDFMSMQGLPVFHDWVIANLAAGRSLSLNAR